MTALRPRRRLWMLAAGSIAAILLVTWAYRQSGLSWITIAVTVIAAGCVAAMAYLWRVSDRTLKTLDELGNNRNPARPRTRPP